MALGLVLVVPRLPPLGALWPVTLSERPAALVDERLRALKSDRALCRRVLVGPNASASPIADHTASEGCGWSNGVKLASAGGVNLSASSITCELAAALALWLAHEVQPLAEALLGERVAFVEHRGTFACRNIRGNPSHAHVRSEHAGANAIDISAFRLVKGRRIAVLGAWSGDGADARFLRAIHQRACRYFRVAIGPGYNAAHRDHFHLDRGPWRACK